MNNMDIVPNYDLAAYDPPFECLRPGKLGNPVVFNSPHSGRCYSPEFLARSPLKMNDLRRSEDLYVDQLFADMPEFGSALLKAHFPRAFLDVNREPYELDQAMFRDKLPDFVNTNSLRVTCGLGTIARIVSEGVDIYPGKLDFAEAEARIKTLYFPYHDKLRALLAEAFDAYRYAVLIDCHSMPSSAVQHSHRDCHIILGDRYGLTCAPAVMDYLEAAFNGAGYKVARNKPYAGGYITQTFGRPFAHVHAVQVEINRGLYINEMTLEKRLNFNKLQQSLSNIFAAFIANLPELIQPAHSQAAE